MPAPFPAVLAVTIAAFCLLGTTNLWYGCYGQQGMDLMFQSETLGTSPRAALVYPKINDMLEEIDNEFTMCIWAHVSTEVKAKQDSVALISYYVYNDNCWHPEELLLLLNLKKNRTEYSIGEQTVYLGEIPPLNQWTHICVSYTGDSGEVSFYIDGKLKRTTDIALDSDYTLEKDGLLVLGQYQDYYRDDYRYQLKTGLNGLLTGFQVFSVPLDEEEVGEVMNCELEGDQLDWEDAVWGLGNGMMVQASTAPGCVGSVCMEPGPQPKVCYDHPTSNSYDVTSNNIKPVKNHNIVRAVLIDPTIKSSLTQFSFCFWLYHNEPKDYKFTPIAYVGKDNSQAIILSFGDKGIIVVGDKNQKFPRVLASKSWIHFCVTWAGDKNGETFIYQNGAPFKIASPLNPNYKLPADGELFVKQDQTAALKENSPLEGFNTKVTDLNFWDHALSADEVKTVMNCSGELPGNVVNWDDTMFEMAF